MKVIQHTYYHKLTASAICLLTGFGSISFAMEQPRKMTLLQEDGDTPVSEQLKMSQEDLKISREIRMSLVGDKNLSFPAKNVKLIVNNGKVTVSGAVKSQEDITRVMLNAAAVAGTSNVINKMKIRNE